MKYTKITYQKAFVIGPYLQEKVGIEIEIDETEQPSDALTEAKRIAETWHIANNQQVHSVEGHPNLLNPEELPVINAAEERIGIHIENATSKEELLKYKDALSTPYLADLYSTKLLQFIKK